MARFTREEIETIDRLWRAVPADHEWTGWAAAGEAPEEIWIFRTHVPIGAVSLFARPMRGTPCILRRAAPSQLRQL